MLNSLGMNKAASFNFIDAAVAGYKALVQHHEVLGQMMLVPLFVKITSFILIFYFGLEENTLRLGLFLLPSYFVEGWLVAQSIRYVFLQEESQGQTLVTLYLRSRVILASTLIYVLIKLLLSGFSGFVVDSGLIENPPQTGQTSSFMVLVSLAFLVAAVWGFRFLWVHVPVALGLHLKEFLNRTRHFQLSFSLLGTWILCFAPIVILTAMLSDMFLPESALAEGDLKATGIGFYIFISVQAVLEIILAVVSGLAVAHGVHEIYKPGKTK